MATVEARTKWDLQNKTTASKRQARNSFELSLRSPRSFQVSSGHVRLLVVVDILRHLPNLHDVVLGDGADDPRLVRVPREVGYLCRVTAVNELQKPTKDLLSSN